MSIRAAGVVRWLLFVAAVAADAAGARDECLRVPVSLRRFDKSALAVLKQHQRGFQLTRAPAAGTAVVKKADKKLRSRRLCIVGKEMAIHDLEQQRKLIRLWLLRLGASSSRCASFARVLVA